MSRVAVQNTNVTADLSGNPAGDLAGRVALVVGCGHLSKSAANVLLAAGADVVVASPCADKLAGFAAHERLHGLDLCLATDRGAWAARRAIQRQFGRLDLVMAALGSWPPPDRVIEPVQFRAQRVLDGDMDAHYSLARTLMPLMTQTAGAQYMLVNDANLGAGVTARLLLKDALAAEGRQIGVQVHTAVLPVGSPVDGVKVGQLARDLMRAPSSHSRTIRLGATLPSLPAWLSLPKLPALPQLPQLSLPTALPTPA
ncbi:MAG: hypothetical protein KC502_03200 [Myxococcales bacterium]|nr:hypothetical protein [Myxococcales bacterium]